MALFTTPVTVATMLFLWSESKRAGSRHLIPFRLSRQPWHSALFVLIWFSWLHFYCFWTQWTNLTTIDYTVNKWSGYPTKSWPPATLVMSVMVPATALPVHISSDPQHASLIHSWAPLPTALSMLLSPDLHHPLVYYSWASHTHLCQSGSALSCNLHIFFEFSTIYYLIFTNWLRSTGCHSSGIGSNSCFRGLAALCNERGTKLDI